jgi:RNA polymerase sigma factor (sigma-70 family)
MRLYEEIFPKIRRYICSNKGSVDDAIDIFQDAMVILCKQARTGNYNLNYDVSGFLFTVCKNRWINKVKRDSRMVRLETQGDKAYLYDFTSDIITTEKVKTLKEMIHKLGEKCFKLLQLAVYQQLENPEICTIMGFATVNAVKTQKYKCKQKLLEMIESDPSYREVIE